MGEMMLWLVGDGALLKIEEGGKETIWKEIKTKQFHNPHAFDF